MESCESEIHGNRVPIMYGGLIITDTDCPHEHQALRSYTLYTQDL